MAANMMTIRAATVMLLCTLPVVAGAQALPDPTRPPVEIGEVTGEGGFAIKQAAPNAKGLLSVIISPTRCAAIIDGKTVKLGEQHDGAQLVEVNANGVVLQGRSGRRMLSLFPGVGVKITAPEPSARKSVSCTLESQKEIRKSPRKTGMKEKI